MQRDPVHKYCECMGFTYSIKVYHGWSIIALLLVEDFKTKDKSHSETCDQTIVTAQTKLPKKQNGYHIWIANFKFSVLLVTFGTVLLHLGVF